MSKFIKLTKLDVGSILVPVEQIVWVVDNIEQKYTSIRLSCGDILENIKEKASDILILINQD